MGSGDHADIGAGAGFISKGPQRWPPLRRWQPSLASSLPRFSISPSRTPSARKSVGSPGTRTSSAAPNIIAESRGSREFLHAYDSAASVNGWPEAWKMLSEKYQRSQFDNNPIAFQHGVEKNIWNELVGTPKPGPHRNEFLVHFRHYEKVKGSPKGVVGNIAPYQAIVRLRQTSNGPRSCQNETKFVTREVNVLRTGTPPSSRQWICTTCLASTATSECQQRIKQTDTAG